ncbi:MAG: response regulator [Sandaracinaceae bacterium]
MTEPRLRSVLVVDDDEDDRFIASRALRKSGCVDYSFAACDGQEALQLFADRAHARALHADAFPPTLTILDINMPRMNGIEFLEALDAMKLPIDAQTDVVVVLSSSDAPEDRATAAEFDLVKGYLVKPLTVTKTRALAAQFGQPAGA